VRNLECRELKGGEQFRGAAAIKTKEMKDLWGKERNSGGRRPLVGCLGKIRLKIGQHGDKIKKGSDRQNLNRMKFVWTM